MIYDNNQNIDYKEQRMILNTTKWKDQVASNRVMSGLLLETVEARKVLQTCSTNARGH